MSMDIRLVRIDSRLLHGQVATVWTKAISPDRILVVSDGVAKDNLRKTLITQAAPAGVEVNVIPVDKLISVYQDPRFDQVKAFLLFETPRDVLRVVKSGVEIKSVNIGSLSFTDGKKMVTDAVAIGGDDSQTFRELHNAGVELEVRKVPTDKKSDLMALLAQEGI